METGKSARQKLAVDQTKADGGFNPLDRPGSLGQMERRSAPRQTLLIRSARLSMGGKEYLCVIRDVSRSGVCLRLFHDHPPAAAAAELLLGNGDRISLRTVRREEGILACDFAEPVELSRIVEEPSRHKRRMTRIGVDLRGTIVGAFGHRRVLVTNISQQGARIEGELGLPSHTPLTLSAAGFPRRQGSVRWSHDRAAGITFESAIPFEPFARLVADLPPAT